MVSRGFAEDEIVKIGRNENNVTVPEITRLYASKLYSKADGGTLRRAVQLRALPESWRSYFLHWLEKQG